MQRLLEQLVREMRRCQANRKHLWAVILELRIRRVIDESRFDLLTDIEEGTRPGYDDDLEPTKVEEVILDMSGEAAYRMAEPHR